jgi:hypothetical protein
MIDCTQSLPQRIHRAYTQRTVHLRRMRELTKLKRTGPPMDTLLADYGLFHPKADLSWIDAASARLSELAEMVRAT